jgi:hypothetical protein
MTDATFVIDYVIEIQIRECVPDDLSPGTGISSRDWTSLRYTQSQQIDEKGYSTVRTNGRLMTRSSLIFKGGPDTLRGMVTPLPIPGFRRTATYTVQADGLALDFDISDKELYLSPPPGAIDASGSHTVSTSNGAKFFVEVNLRLECIKHISKKIMMEMAIAIAMERIKRTGVQNVPGTQTPFIQSGAFREDLYGPNVEVTLRGMVNGPTKKASAKSSNSGFWGNIPGIIGGVIGWKAGAKLGGRFGGIPGAILGAGVGELLKQKFGADQPLGVIDIAIQAAQAAANGRGEPAVLDTFHFGGDPLGSSKDLPQLLAPKVRGYLPLMTLIAGAFSDECIAEKISMAQSEASMLKSKVQPRGQGVDSKLQSNGVTPSALISNSTSSLIRNAGISTDDAVEMMGIDIVKRQSESVVNITSSLPVFEESDSLAGGDESDGIWDHYSCEFVYHKRTGRSVLPAQMAESNAAVVRLDDGVMLVKVLWSASKLGAAPMIPEEESADPNLVFMESTVGLSDVKLGADGQTLEYSATGEYVYAALAWRDVTKEWPIPPWLAVEQSQLSTYADSGSTISGEESTVSALASNQRP